MTNNVPHEFPCKEVAGQYSFPTTKLTDVIVGRCMKEVLNGYVTPYPNRNQINQENPKRINLKN
jgi:hypothetical protein